MSVFTKNQAGEKVTANKYGRTLALAADGTADEPIFIGTGSISETPRGMYLNRVQVKALIKELVKVL